MMRRSGVIVLEGDGAVLRLNGVSVGVAGVKGFGGGFAGACATDFGEPEMKSFVATTRRSADGLEAALRGLDTSVRVALMQEQRLLQVDLTDQRGGIGPCRSGN